jgi:hypothetical protein
VLNYDKIDEQKTRQNANIVFAFDLQLSYEILNHYCLSFYSALERCDRENRVARDILRMRDEDPGRRVTFFEGRLAMSRIFAILGVLSAMYGRDAAFTPEIDRALVALGCSPFERAEVGRRLANGFAIEALTPGSALAGGPPPELLVDSLKASHGGDVGEAVITAALAWLSRSRAASELIAAAKYKAAAENYEEMLRKSSPPRELHRSVCGIDLSPPPFVFTDGLECKGLEEIFAGVHVDRKAMTLPQLLEIMGNNGSLASDASQIKNVALILASIAGTNDLSRIRLEHVALYRILLELLPKFYGQSRGYKQLSLQDILLSTETLPSNEIGLAKASINRHISQAGKLVNAALQHGFVICDPKALLALRVSVGEGSGKGSAKCRQKQSADYIVSLAAGVRHTIARWGAAPNIRIDALDVILGQRLLESLDERSGHRSSSSDSPAFTVADAALVVAGWRSGRILFAAKWW